MNNFKQKKKNFTRPGGAGRHPVKKGLGSFDGTVRMFVDNSGSSEANGIINGGAGLRTEEIPITTLDKFVQEQNLKKVDFIKADIEGSERDMLKGAYGVLKEFAPKLALCTYHLPDDPQVLENIILESNPNYKVKHISKKLFAAV
jgi:FkbM family methyltransferase